VEIFQTMLDTSYLKKKLNPIPTFSIRVQFDTTYDDTMIYDDDTICADKVYNFWRWKSRFKP